MKTLCEIVRRIEEYYISWYNSTRLFETKFIFLSFPFRILLQNYFRRGDGFQERRMPSNRSKLFNFQGRSSSVPVQI